LDCAPATTNALTKLRASFFALNVENQLLYVSAVATIAAGTTTFAQIAVRSGAEEW
jgi:hypothetical protein